MAAWKCHSSSCSLVYGSCTPNLRAMTSKVVTHAMIDQQPPGRQGDPFEQPAHTLRQLQQRVHRVRPSPPRTSAAATGISPRPLPRPERPAASPTLPMARSARARRRMKSGRANCRQKHCCDCTSRPERDRCRRRGRRSTAAAPAVTLLAGVGRLHRLRLAPDRVLLAEVEVVIGDLLEQRILGRLLREHLEPCLLESGERPCRSSA